MPATYQIDFGEVLQFKGPDGSLFGSPSSTACAFIATKDSDFLNYLKSMFQKVENGAPATYPVDEGFIKLWMVDLLENLGLEEYFSEEIQKVLNDTYILHKPGGPRSGTSDGLDCKIHSPGSSLRFGTLDSLACVNLVQAKRSKVSDLTSKYSKDSALRPRSFYNVCASQAVRGFWSLHFR
ncbi:hypothetical protein AMTR_s00003p00256260 [Amborella trichopoda]|uniref:Terpene synthase N-terminal domain-containing protein n=1 Tax=Amborella trichopoda TaxID=13333 RepID=W1P0M6_AMBTC|nr:hypothetical protein AMTR_s00003p00256260 [Amborella trichopoda]